VTVSVTTCVAFLHTDFRGEERLLAVSRPLLKNKLFTSRQSVDGGGG